MASSIFTKIPTFAGCRWLYAVIVCTCLWICFAPSLVAAEPVEVIVGGVGGAALDNVREALALPPGLVRDGKADRLWVEHFARQVEEKSRTALEPFGYYSARVRTTVEAVSEGEFRLHVSIEPGEPVRIAKVNVALNGPGALEESLKKEAAAFPLHGGDVLLQRNYEEAKGRLLALAQGLAYLDAGFSVHEIRISQSRTSARIELVLETGEKYFFDDAKLLGAPDYPEEFLRRFLAFKPGDTFSYAKLGETQLNFTNSERFKEVIITPKKEEARQLRVPVLVQLKQAPRRSLRPGVGYGTDTGARFSVRYRDLNMFHQGHELNVNLYLAERLQGLAAGYTLPSTLDIRSSTAVRLNLQREDVATYVSRLLAVELSRNRSFGEGRLGTAYIKLQQEEFTIGTQESRNRLVLPGVRFSGTHYDNPVRPTGGYRYSSDVRGTDQFLGSDTGLLQFITEGSYLVPMPWRLSLHTRAKAGITVLSDPLSDLPPSLRFFAGGDRSVRGYAYQSLGPSDASGRVVGGKHLLSGSVELERALFKDWGVSLFYDAGNAVDTFTDFRLFQGAGAGVHYHTRIGSLNLYVARQIAVDNPAFRIHFTVGFEL